MKYKNNFLDTQTSKTDTFGRPVKRTRPIVSEITMTIPSEKLEETNQFTILWKNLMGEFFTIDPTSYGDNSSHKGESTDLYADVIRGQIFEVKRNLHMEDNIFTGQGYFDITIREIL